MNKKIEFIKAHIKAGDEIINKKQESKYVFEVLQAPVYHGQEYVLMRKESYFSGGYRLENINEVAWEYVEIWRPEAVSVQEDMRIARWHRVAVSTDVKENEKPLTLIEELEKATGDKVSQYSKIILALSEILEDKHKRIDSRLNAIEGCLCKLRT